MTLQSLRKYSEEEYLHFDAQNPYRSAYVGGFIFPMYDYGHTEPFTRLTSKHGLVCSSLCALLHAPARAAGLSLYSGNMRVKTGGYRNMRGKQVRQYEMPDLVATSENVTPTATHLNAPQLIVEVLSPRTRDLDRWYKLEKYQLLPSLTHYLLVDTVTRAARLYTRQGKNWAEQYAEQEGDLRLSTPEITLTLGEIYEGVTL